MLLRGSTSNVWFVLGRIAAVFALRTRRKSIQRSFTAHSGALRRIYTEKRLVLNSFNDLNLSPNLMRAIEELGYTKPSPIQAEALPVLMGDPTDFLGLAATGTGKTAAFSIPLLERIDPAVRSVQALILCPTRELALQVCGQINLLGKHMGISALPIYGGSSYGDQLRGLKRGVNVVVGTPGRLIDHMEKGSLVLDDLNVVVLDEADEMISMGFKEDLEAILAAAPRESSNIWLFSATMSSEIRKLADGYLVEPAFIQINRTEVVPDTIEQLYYKTHEGDKPEILCKLIEAADDFFGLVFCQTKALVVDLTRYLKDRGYQVDCLHGDMDQDARERTMRAFRERKVKVLVCTDVASRGLDVKDITHVVNYSLPRELDNYVHRIGRTARSGKTGVAMSLVTPSHKGLISRIERMTKSRMNEGRIPSRKEIGAKKVSKCLAVFEGVQEQAHSRAVSLLEGDEAWKAALATLTSEQIAGRFLALMNPDIFGERDEPAPTQHTGHIPGKAPVRVKSSASTGLGPVKSSAAPKVAPLATPAPARAERSFEERDGTEAPSATYGAPRERKTPYFKEKRERSEFASSSDDSERGLGRAPGHWTKREDKGSSRSYAGNGGGSPWAGKPRTWSKPKAAPSGTVGGAGTASAGGGFSKDFSGKPRSRFERPLSRGGR